MTPTITVQIQSDQGILMSDDNRMVTISLGAGQTGVQLCGTTSEPAIGGIAAFSDLTVDGAGTYTLTASAPGLQPAMSDQFTVSAPQVDSSALDRIANSGFEGGQVAWSYYTNGGSGNSFAVVPSATGAMGLKMGKVTLGATVGTNNQLYQKGIALESGKAYQLQFRVAASQTTKLRTRVIEQDEDYTVYGFPFVSQTVTVQWQTVRLRFTAGNFVGTVNDAMIQFYFVSSTPATTIYFDEVSITPMLRENRVGNKRGGGDEIVGEGTTPEGPGEFSLSQNYPNPFNPTTTIRYGLPALSDVRLSVFDILGREVSVLWHGMQEAGWHEATFDASGLASGVYIYRLQAKPQDGSSAVLVQTKRLLLVR
jgi:hypothetical protein